MKKCLAMMLAVVLLLGTLVGCASGKDTAGSDDGRIRIVTTVFPAYDWVKNILGNEPDNIELTWLLDEGVDMHSYQPSMEDILTISTCDLFVCVGGESDRWADEVLKNALNKEMTVVRLLEVLGDAARVEETVEGMQIENDAGDESEEYDEHVWLSLRNAMSLVETLSKTLQELDPPKAEEYAVNAAAYVEKMQSLETRYQKAVDEASVRTLLFGDRFPFRYMTEDYGLSYYAAFSGCSAETEASFEIITFLSGKADELGLHTILKTEGSDGKIAETVVQNTESKDLKVLTLDSMQSVTGKQAEDGATYLSVMENNLSILTEAME